MSPRRTERVAALAAECIRTLVWKRFHTKMDHSHFVQLGRNSTSLTSSLADIERRRQQTYESIPNRDKATELAVVHSSLESSGRLSGEGLTKLIEIRKGIHGLMNAQSYLSRVRQEHVRRIAATKADVNEWTAAYTSFMDALSTLYLKRKQELLSCSLNDGSHERAMAELEEVVKRAAVEATHV